MSDSENDPLSSLLSSFALGPAWARATGDKPERKPKEYAGGDDRPQRRDDRGRGPREGGGSRGREGGERRPFQGRGDLRGGPPQRVEEIRPEEGVRATVAPDPQAVHLIGKEVHQVARVYPLFDVAKILLAEKSRCRAIFEAPEPHAPLIQGKGEDSVFLTREEAARHLWASDRRAEFIEEETIDVDPPTGNFQAIARCGISGEWLGPVNFHSYQPNLRRLHRERFSRMPFELYASKVRTERGEEAVNAWLETMKKKTRWRIKGDEEGTWIEDRAEAERALASRCFDKAFKETRKAEVSGAIPDKNLSPSLLVSLKVAGTHARNHPAILIPAVCRAVEAEHLPVFKRSGKLHTGPARPHSLPADAVLAERPAKMVAWIRENPPAKLEGLWKAVLPEGGTAPPGDYAADLFWLLHQGHILLFTDDTLVVQEGREGAGGEAGSGAKKTAKKKKGKKAAPEGKARPLPQLTADAAAGDPGDTSGEPENSAGEPENSSGIPEDSAGEPEDSAGEPEDSVGEPENSVGEPENSVGEPENSVGEPENSAGEPENSAGEPENSLGEPENSAGEPEDSAGEPENSAGEPENSVGEREKPDDEPEQSVGEPEQSVGETEQSVGEPEDSVGETEPSGGHAGTSAGDPENPAGDSEATPASAATIFEPPAENPPESSKVAVEELAMEEEDPEPKPRDGNLPSPE